MAFSRRLQASLILMVGALLHSGESQTQCIQTGTCTCMFQDATATIVNFASIGRRDGKPKFDFGNYGQAGSFQYAFNPCFAFNAGTCKGVVGCQEFTDDSSFFEIGDPIPEQWTTQSDGVIKVTYRSTDVDQITRTSIVDYTCDTTATQPTLVITSVQPQIYNMQIKTCAACNPAVPGCPTASSSGSGGLTGGGILCIIFTIVVLVYIIAGILFQKFARGATGKELIPNYNFWVGLPGLIKDGFLFMLSPCVSKGRGGYDDMSKT